MLDDSAHPTSLEKLSVQEHSWALALVHVIWPKILCLDHPSHLYRLTWGCSAIFLGAYTTIQWLNIPLIVQAQLFGFLCFLCWGQVRYVASSILPIQINTPQCQYYGFRRSRVVAVTITILVMAASGALEYSLFAAVKAQSGAGTHGPTTVIGIIGSVLLSVALLPQYWEIYKLKEVAGVSMPFLLIDILGGVFNNLSLVFKEKFDVVASISYTLVIVSSLFFSLFHII